LRGLKGGVAGVQINKFNLSGIGLTLAAGMSALTLDLGEISGLFTRLTAVVAIFRGGASARGMCTFV
jgi:hypothetical protein